MEDHHHHPLRGAREKVRWADEHIGALDKEVAAWMDKHDNLVAGEFYAEAQVAALRVHAPDPPPRWGVMTGNIVHCARSALDYLIWQLVEHHGVKKPKAGPGGNQFPIIDTAPPAGFAKNTKGWLQGVHPDHRAIIEWFQPYERTGD